MGEPTKRPLGQCASRGGATIFGFGEYTSANLASIPCHTTEHGDSQDGNLHRLPVSVMCAHPDSTADATPTRCLRGSVAEVIVWEQPLLPAHLMLVIRQGLDYRGYAGRRNFDFWKALGLLAYYDLGEGAGTIAADATSTHADTLIYSNATTGVSWTND
eukprot:980369-Prorocentrum_minimum.AAC.1